MNMILHSSHINSKELFSFPMWKSEISFQSFDLWFLVSWKFFQFIFLNQVACNLVIFLLDFQLHFEVTFWLLTDSTPIKGRENIVTFPGLIANWTFSFSEHEKWENRIKIVEHKEETKSQVKRRRRSVEGSRKFINYCTNYDDKGRWANVSKVYENLYENLTKKHFLVFFHFQSCCWWCL